MNTKIHDIMGSYIKINYEFVNEIPLTKTGKYRVTISNLNKSTSPAVENTIQTISSSRGPSVSHHAPTHSRKILHIINSLDCGGLEKFVVDLSIELNKRGHKAQIACLEPGGELNLLAKDNDLKIHTFHKKGGVDYSRINKIVSSNEILFGRHLIIKAIKTKNSD